MTITIFSNVDHCCGWSAAATFRKIQIMDTMTLPEVILPDLKLQPDEMLLDPGNIRLNEDIFDTDVIIDDLINHLKKDEVDASWLFAVKEFSHEDKVKWILSLPEPERELGCMGYLLLVTVYLYVMVKVAETAAGEPLYEKKRVEKKVEKCFPKNEKPN